MCRSLRLRSSDGVEIAPDATVRDVCGGSGAAVALSVVAAARAPFTVFYANLERRPDRNARFVTHANAAGVFGERLVRFDVDAGVGNLGVMVSHLALERLSCDLSRVSKGVHNLKRVPTHILWDREIISRRVLEERTRSSLTHVIAQLK